MVPKLRPGLLNPRQILNHLPAQDDWYSIANKHSSDVVDVYLVASAHNGSYGARTGEHTGRPVAEGLASSHVCLLVDTYRGW